MSLVKLNELEEIIKTISCFYEQITEQWDIETKPYLYNQATTMVKDINVNILSDIVEYVEFLNKKTLKILSLTSQSFVNHTRVKAFNSIISKYLIYENKTVNGEKGTMAINKCFNDLFGLRILTEEKFSFFEVKRLVENKFKNIKCIEAIRGNYKAIHLYFKVDNKHYQWELQIWFEGDEKTNIESHAKHKQQYTTWEKDLKDIKLKKEEKK